jgi:hypothetical protein
VFANSKPNLNAVRDDRLVVETKKTNDNAMLLELVDKTSN